MANIGKREKKDGSATCQVKWREAGAWQSERFGEEPAAEQFKALVDVICNYL